MVKAVYCFNASCIAICQKPAFRSKKEKYPALTRLSMASFVGGKLIGDFLGSGIQLMKVNAKVQTSIFLAY